MIPGQTSLSRRGSQARDSSTKFRDLWTRTPELLLDRHFYIFKIFMYLVKISGTWNLPLSVYHPGHSFHLQCRATIPTLSCIGPIRNYNHGEMTLDSLHFSLQSTFCLFEFWAHPLMPQVSSSRMCLSRRGRDDSWEGDHHKKEVRGEVVWGYLVSRNSMDHRRKGLPTVTMAQTDGQRFPASKGTLGRTWEGPVNEMEEEAILRYSHLSMTIETETFSNASCTYPAEATQGQPPENQVRAR